MPQVGTFFYFFLFLFYPSIILLLCGTLLLQLKIRLCGDTNFTFLLRLPFTDCGAKGSNRIVGGEEAGENEFPWMCAVLNADNSFYGCGATILSCNPTIIISAAHCFERANG